MEKIEFSEEVYRQLGDAIVWTTILAAVHQDGVIESDERAEAIYQSHVRTKTSKEFIQPIYEHLETHFEKDFDAYCLLLPEEYEGKIELIQGKLEKAMEVVREIGPVFTKVFSDDLESLYEKVFNAHHSIFESFALPFISGHMREQENKKN